MKDSETKREPRTIKTRIVLDGADEYLKQIESVNQELKRTEKLLTSINKKVSKLKKLAHFFGIKIR